MFSPRRIFFLAYDGFELLDLSGPASVYSTANVLRNSRNYETLVISSEGGEVSSGDGLSIITTRGSDVTFGPKDTVLVLGAYDRELTRAMACPGLKHILRAASETAARYGSICTGAFVLAASGLLDGKRVATHWAGCAALEKAFPKVKVNPHSLYEIDGRIWTSAGVTTGIDMALAMVGEDHGQFRLGEIAKRLVVYAHRPGHQGQFSSVLEAQMMGDGGFSKVIAWLDTRLDQKIRVLHMADYARMSERTFYRKFTAAIGVSPSKFLEIRRLETAKNLLENGLAVKSVSRRVGFNSDSAFRQAFRKRFGLNPSFHAGIHARKTGHLRRTGRFTDQGDQINLHIGDDP